MRLVMLLCTLLQASSLAAAPATRPVKIIFDTDMDSDCDDLGALAILHALADRGECEILAVMVSSANPASPLCASVINHYYGRPGLPIGVVRGKAAQKPSKYAQQLADAFPHTLRNAADAPDAVKLYRDLLLQHDPVTIVTVGYLTNIKNLLQLPAADGKPAGTDLIKTRVGQWVCMGGNFIGDPAKDDLKLGNNNFTYDRESAHYAIHHWPGKLMFVGREVASVPSGLKIGENLRNTPMTNPIRVGYRLYHNGADKSRHIADPASVLFAVRGLTDCWDARTGGFMDLNPDTTFAWRSDIDRNQGHLLKKKGPDGKPNDRYVESILDALLTQPPRSAGKAAE